jgi:hypothetical protein
MHFRRWYYAGSTAAGLNAELARARRAPEPA